MAISLNKILASVYSKLTGGATLMSKVTGIFNEVPQSQTFPFVVLNDSDLIQVKWNTFGRKGKETSLFIHVYSIAKTDKEVIAIAEEIDLLLDNVTLAITSNTNILTSFERIEIVTEEGSSQQIKTKHAILEYRIMTTES